MSLLTGGGGALLACMQQGLNIARIISVEIDENCRRTFRKNMRIWAPGAEILEPVNDIGDFTQEHARKICSEGGVDLVLGCWECKCCMMS